MSLTPRELKELAAALAPLIAAELAKTADVYSTRRGAAPPGWSLDAWRVAAPKIPGAHKPGRWWVVSKVAYEAWVASKSGAAMPATNGTTPANDSWDPSSVLDSLGLKRPGGGR